MAAASSVSERVKAGATFMDMAVPGWAGKVDRSRFDMSLCGGCVIGQMYGHYYAGQEVLGLDDQQSIALGFHSSVGFLRDHDGCVAQYAALRLAWLAEIDARLTGDVVDETDLSPVATWESPL